MKFIVLNSLILFFGFTFLTISAAPIKSHSHNGRAHSHILPASGLKHYHKHTHGGRSHIHPLPASGKNHFHSKKILKRQVKKQTPPKYRNSIQRQIDAVLKSSAVNNPEFTKRTAPISVIKNKPTVSKSNQTKAAPKHATVNNATFKKVLNYGKHQHNGRSHQHALPATGKMHTHKYLQKKVNEDKNTKVKILKPKIAKAPIRNIAKKQAVVVPKKHYRRPIKPRNPQQIENAKRQFKLGLRYENGSGVDRNIKQAINWYRRAAQQGNANAQVNLGNLYATGNGVPKNMQEAKRWYTFAANQGDMRGRANLNYMVER